MMTLTGFLEPFFGDDETIYGRAIKAKNYEKKISTVEFEFTRNRLKTDRELQKYLKDLNRERGMYFVVNEGGGSDVFINRINAAFCEIDDLPIEEQNDIYDNAPLPPSIRVETKKSIHAYWLLNEEILPNEFVILQKGLIDFFGSDKGICNPSRLMRLPFFNHVSAQNGELFYKPVSIHTFSWTGFNFTELHEAYPFTPPKPKPEPKFNQFNSDGKLEAAHAELIERIKSTHHYHRSGDFGYTSGLCHNGKESDTALYVNFNTGFVSCFAGCQYKEIATALGVNFK